MVRQNDIRRKTTVPQFNCGVITGLASNDLGLKINDPWMCIFGTAAPNALGQDAHTVPHRGFLHLRGQRNHLIPTRGKCRAKVFILSGKILMN
jgi:hypothetical protein